jgi:Undecaprenyl-phosphate glucose phosphotransferase
MNYFKRDFGEPKSLALPAHEAQQRPSRGWTIPYRAITPVAMAVDTLVIFATCVLSHAFYHMEIVKLPGHLSRFAGFAAVVSVLFVVLAENRKLYTLPELLNFKTQVRSVTVNWSIIFLFLTAVAYAMKVGENFSRGTTIAFAVSGLIALIGVRIVWRIYLADGLAIRKFSSRKVALIAEQTLISDSSLPQALLQHGLQPVKHFVLPLNQMNAKRCREIIAQAITSIRGSDVEEIVISVSLDHWTKLNDLFSELRVLPLPVNLVPMGQLSELFRLSSHSIGDIVTIELQQGPRTRAQRFVKRVSDIALSLGALIALIPLLSFTAIAIKLDSPGPVVFRQWRRGFNGRPFQIFKFRTMSVQEDGDVVVAAKRDDNRVTRVGNWLRRTSIDELPQLFNVLFGSMSIVGPRPHAMAHDNEFEKVLSNYAYRQHVKPGLTGWAQVHGYRGQMSTVEDVEQRVKYDLWYIDNWSFAIDIKIIFMTATEVIDGKNAY